MEESQEELFEVFLVEGQTEFLQEFHEDFLEKSLDKISGGIPGLALEKPLLGQPKEFLREFQEDCLERSQQKSQEKALEESVA